MALIIYIALDTRNQLKYLSAHPCGLSSQQGKLDFSCMVAQSFYSTKVDIPDLVSPRIKSHTV